MIYKEDKALTNLINSPAVSRDLSDLEVYGLRMGLAFEGAADAERDIVTVYDATTKENKIYVPIAEAAVGPIKSQPLREIILPEGIYVEEFRAVLDNAYILWINGPAGEHPPAGIISRRTHIPTERIKAIMTTPQYILAAKTRGINPGKHPGLSSQQIIALEVMMDPTAGGGLEARLRKAGVKMATYRAWMKQAAFKAERDRLAGNLLGDHEADMVASLTSAAAAGDLNAIRYAFEMSGKYNPANQNVMHIREVLAMVAEIVQTEIKDADTLNRVGARIVMLGQSSGAFNNVGPNQNVIEGNVTDA